MKKLSLAILIILGAAACHPTPAQKPVGDAATNTGSQSSQPQAETPIFSDLKLNQFSFPKSPAYKNCDPDKSYADTTFADYSLAGTSQGKSSTIVPSLRKFFADQGFIKNQCQLLVFAIFAAPPDKNEVFISNTTMCECDAPPSLIDVFKVDLSNLTASRLKTTADIQPNETYGFPLDYYQVLNGATTAVKWQSDQVDLINLDQDSSKVIFKPEGNLWLIKEMDSGLLQTVAYDVKVQSSSMQIGLYDKTQTESGQKITIDKYNNVSPENADGTVSPKFVKTVIVPIPQ